MWGAGQGSANPAENLCFHKGSLVPCHQDDKVEHCCYSHLIDAGTQACREEPQLPRGRPQIPDLHPRCPD